MIDFSSTRISLKRPIGSYAKVQAAYSAVIRNSLFQLRHLKSSNKHYLNIGCGPNITPEFINLDYTWRPGIDICWDITRKLPLKHNSLSGIYSEHCIEHIPETEARSLLSQCFNQLKPGGTIRIAVPDAELYLDLYVKAKQGEHVVFPYENESEMKTASTAIKAVNRVFRDYGHLYAYDYYILKEILENIGFTDINRASYRQGRDSRLLIDTLHRQVESLYIEASKPG